MTCIPVSAAPKQVCVHLDVDVACVPVSAAPKRVCVGVDADDVYVCVCVPVRAAPDECVFMWMYIWSVGQVHVLLTGRSHLCLFLVLNVFGPL